jgi:hypothetical protein
VLLDWPPDYPAHMRSSFTLLLEKIAVQLDCQTRRELAARFAAAPDAPLPLLNELFFDSARETRADIVARMMQCPPDDELAAPVVDEATLIRAVRDYPPEVFVQTLARLLGIPAATAARAVADASGEGLAILCKGARLSRMSFSTIAMLTDASLESAQRKLDMYDAIADDTSIRVVQYWRAQRNARPVRASGAEAA